MTDSGIIPMSWVYCVRGWKSEQLCLNTFKELGTTSCRQIGPSNSFSEKGISCQDKVVIRKDQGDPSDGMSWCVKDIKMEVLQMIICSVVKMLFGWLADHIH